MRVKRRPPRLNGNAAILHDIFVVVRYRLLLLFVIVPHKQQESCRLGPSSWSDARSGRSYKIGRARRVLLRLPRRRSIAVAARVVKSSNPALRSLSFALPMLHEQPEAEAAAVPAQRSIERTLQ
jgi:hypothetical protein